MADVSQHAPRDDDDHGHLLDHLRVLHRRRWPAIAAFLITFPLLVVDTFLATPMYEAKARLLIEAGKPNVVSFQDVVEEGQARSDYYETQYNLLRSRSVARRTLDALKLWERPPFGGGEPQQRFSLRGALVSLVTWPASLARKTLAPASAQPRSAAAGETAAQSRAVDVLLGGLTVAPVRASRIVDLSFRATDPELAAEIANAHAKAYIEQNMEFRFLASKEATDWLAARLGEAKDQVAAAENALQRYREQNDTISFDDRDNVVVQRLTDMSVVATRAKTDRIEKEALYKQLTAIQNNPAALDAFPAVVSNAFVQQQKMEIANLQRQEASMAEKLGDKHPDMVKIRAAIKAAQAKMQMEINRIVLSVRNDYQAAEAQEENLQGALDAQKRQALAMNEKAIEYGVLRRDVDSARQIYDTLLQRAKETGVSSELRTSNLRIVDPAEVPSTPVSPNKRNTAIEGLIISTGLALAVAFFFEYLDNRIKRPEEIKVQLGIPVLGMVPLTVPAKGHGTVPMVNDGVPPDFIEAIRALRTNVLFSSAEAGSRTIAVTSSEPSEGKTTIATNLAIALAQAGQRVLIIDADMRRPAVHERFGRKAEPGLSNLLVGNSKASEVVIKSIVQGLWVLPAGRVPPNPAELLGSKRFNELLGSLREHFDWIVIDTPPVLAVTDASVVAHGVSGIVLVVGVEMVSRHAARSAVDQLTTVNGRVLGAVLNRVDLKRHAYYYARHYQREYARYYHRPGA